MRKVYKTSQSKIKQSSPKRKQAYKKSGKDEFEKACALDDKIRNGLHYKNELFLHRYRKPLREVDLKDDQMSIFDDEFTEECEGFCGI